MSMVIDGRGLSEATIEKTETENRIEAKVPIARILAVSPNRAAPGGDQPYS